MAGLGESDTSGSVEGLGGSGSSKPSIVKSSRLYEVKGAGSGGIGKGGKDGGLKGG